MLLTLPCSSLCMISKISPIGRDNVYKHPLIKYIIFSTNVPLKLFLIILPILFLCLHPAENVFLTLCLTEFKVGV